MEVFLIGCLGGVDLVGAGDLLSLACGVYLVDGKGEAISLEVCLLQRWELVDSILLADVAEDEPVLAVDPNQAFLVVYEASGRRADRELAEV
jgi:hypothetical protein